MVNRRDRKGQVGAQRESHQSDILWIDVGLTLQVSDPIPDSLSPDRKMADGSLLIGNTVGAATFKIMRHEDRKPLGSEQRRRPTHARVTTTRAVQSDNHGKTTMAVGDEGVVADGMASRFERGD